MERRWPNYKEINYKTSGLRHLQKAEKQKIHTYMQTFLLFSRYFSRLLTISIRRKPLLLAKYLKILKESQIYCMSCLLLIMLDQYLLKCIMAALGFISKSTPQWSKDVKLYILQFKLNTVIICLFVKMTEKNSFSKYLNKRSHCFSKIVQRMQYIRRA